MKTYRIEFADVSLSRVLSMPAITLLCLRIIGLPLAIATIPTMYRIVEE